MGASAPPHAPQRSAQSEREGWNDSQNAGKVDFNNLIFLNTPPDPTMTLMLPVAAPTQAKSCLRSCLEQTL